ncbi:hypothetical protein KEJ24_00550 [Candidatus Bathyarchaeota archaeon]|nr:hypothetical protein [Candidatus Bathyarchaeota archaeon]
MSEISRDMILDKFKAVKKDVDVILFKQLEGGGYIGITAKDFAGMLNWILRGKVVEETVKGYAEDGSPIIERKERDPTFEEIKQRFKDSGYAQLFEEWLAKGVVSLKDLQELFGGKLPWR